MKTTIIFLLFLLMFFPTFSQEQNLNRELPDYGLVLSGGGAVGFAHIGALMALEEEGIKISMVSGASMGAIIGAMYAYGYSAQDILNIVEDQKFYKKSNIFTFNIFNRGGLSSHKKVQKILDTILHVNSFDSLQLFFALSMTDFASLETEYAFSGDKLKEKILASVSIPSIFNPMEIDGKIYVDGGVMNNLPIEPIRDKCNKVIMIDVNVVGNNALTSGKLKIGYRAGMAMFKQMNADRIAQADYYIGLSELEKYNLLDFGKYDAIIKIGYEGMKKYLKEHEELR